MSAVGLQSALERMRADGSTPEAIAVFSRFYRQLEQGASGLIAESSIEPVAELPRLDDLRPSLDQQRSALAQTVVIKLNGGLGTSMGMDRAKSLLTVKDGHSFLDIIAGQVLALRRRYDVHLPLLLMNSFRTQDDTRRALAEFTELGVGLAPDFLQSREPKLRADDLSPVDWPADRDLEWCPPGHGDVYPALRSSGLLAELISAGYRYAFCSNSDNLGAVADPRIAGWMAEDSVPFVMESCRRTPADRKGGHLARRRADGRLILRETAQTSGDDIESLQDLTRHKYCNTNNIWLDLHALSDVLAASDGAMALPLIRNAKTVDPSDPSSPQVIQIESAMGAAVEVFEGARSVEVGRDRFVPVKTTNDLLVLRSDVYELDGDFQLTKAPARGGREDPYVDLDPSVFKLVPDFERRFPQGPPSLVESEELVVRGDVTFGADVVVRGSVSLKVDEPTSIGAGATLD
jgi:UTP--glucose-1-phosphate uridylyltransferase